MPKRVFKSELDAVNNSLQAQVTNSISKTIVDAKGDLITATGADTPARLTVGSNGYTLVADSSTSTGLAYAGTTNGNPVINGGFDIWQRGTSIAGTTTAYTADRWNLYRAVAGSTCSRQVTGDTTNLPNIQYCARVQRDSGNTSTANLYFGTSVETSNSIPYAGKTINVSFYARAGANYSASSSALKAEVITGTGTDQNAVTGSFTGAATPISQTATLTTTWQRFSYSATLASTATELAVQFTFTPVGTAGAADYFEITGVQIDLGSTALPFRRSGGTIQGELAACQRYYWRQTAVSGVSAYTTFATGMASSTTIAAIPIFMPVTMRTYPTVLDYSTLRVQDTANGYTVTALSLDSNFYGYNSISLNATVASGLTQFRTYTLGANNSGSAYIGLSAEL